MTDNHIKRYNSMKSGRALAALLLIALAFGGVIDLALSVPA